MREPTANDAQEVANADDGVAVGMLLPRSTCSSLPLGHSSAKRIHKGLPNSREEGPSMAMRQRGGLDDPFDKLPFRAKPLLAALGSRLLPPHLGKRPNTS